MLHDRILAVRRNQTRKGCSLQGGSYTGWRVVITHPSPASTLYLFFIIIYFYFLLFFVYFSSSIFFAAKVRSSFGHEFKLHPFELALLFFSLLIIIFGEYLNCRLVPSRIWSPVQLPFDRWRFIFFYFSTNQPTTYAYTVATTTIHGKITSFITRDVSRFFSSPFPPTILTENGSTSIKNVKKTTTVYILVRELYDLSPPLCVDFQ